MYKMIGWDALLELRSQTFVMEEQYQKIVKQTTSADDLDNDDNLNTNEDTIEDLASLNTAKYRPKSSPVTVFMFEDKRVCERWFDDLFTILFEASCFYYASVIIIVTTHCK